MNTKLSSQLQRFIASDFKKGRFTNDLYIFLSVHTNVFIAHFNKEHFYVVRFESGADKTIECLRSVKKGDCKALCNALADAMEERLVIIETIVETHSVTKVA